LRPHRPQRSRHWISRAWCGRLERCHCRYRPHRGPPSARTEPRSRWPDWISAWARTVRTVRTVAPRRFLARRRMVRVGARPSRRPLAVSTASRHFRAHAGDAGAEHQSPLPSRWPRSPFPRQIFKLAFCRDNGRIRATTRNFLLLKLMSSEIRVKDAENVAEAALQPFESYSQGTRGRPS
jgi:hypothetical protein